MICILHLILRNKHDENGAIIGVGVKNAGDARFTSYYYAKNLQGDVVAVYRSDYTEAKGYYPTLVASYEYDPWGKVKSVKGSAGTELSLSAYPNHIAHVNPIRYRGYYYDNETGFYYLQSRYYDPAICRFINADEYSDTDDGLLGFNMFAYCLNDPMNRTDDNGCLSFKNIVKLAVGAVALAGAVALTVATGGGGAAVAIGVAKIVGSVALSTAVSAGAGYLRNGKQGAIDGACNGFMLGSLSACGGAALKYISSPSKGIDTYRNLRKINRGTGKQAHHIVEKRFADSLGIKNTNNMLSIALKKAEHKVFTDAWRAALPYGGTYSKGQILGAAIKIYAKHPGMLVAAVRTII